MEHSKKINMRSYLAKIELTDLHKNMSSGAIAENVFQQWFKSNFQGEKLHKQLADRDYQGIDFADEKGITYQIKGSKGKTFTFNCCLDDLREHLRADKYVCVQITDKAAYIEFIYSAENILERAKSSFQYEKSCFVWAKDLNQYALEL